MNNPLKTIKRDDEQLIVGNYIIMFGDAQTKDFDGEFFTPQTDVTSPHTQIGKFPVDWEHQLMKSDAPQGAIGFVDWTTAKSDDKGIFVQRVLDRRNQYIQMLDDAGFFDDGLIASSSEANGRMVQKSRNGRIDKWPLIGDALTVTPAEPRMMKENQLHLLKSIGLEMELPETAQDTVSATVTTDDNTVSTLDIMENEIMSEETSIQELVTDAVKASLSGIGEMITEAVDKAVDARQPLKTGLTVVEDEVDKELRERPFKSFGEFLIAVARGDDNRLKATKSDVPGMERGYFDVSKAIKAPTGLGELIPADGGFLVGTDQMAGVLQRDYNTGELLRRVDTVTVSGNANSMTFNAVDETSRANGSRQGGIRAYWTAEASTKTASNPTFRQMRLTLQKVAALVYATDELLQDTTALETWINNNLPDEIRFVVEDAIVNGTGAGMPLGILNSNALVSVAAEAGQAATTLLAENVIKIWGRRWVGRGSANYVWLVNQDVEQQLHQMSLPVGTGGALVYMPPGGLSQSPYGSLYGRPVIPVEYMPTLGTAGDILLADLSQYQAIDKGGIMGASSIHVRFINDETTFRFVYRYDGEPKWDSALTPFNGTNTVSPFVTVATRS